MKHWQSRKLGDILTFKRGYDLPERLRVDGKYPIVSSSGISGSHNDFKVHGSCVVTGRYGTLGIIHYVSGKCWPLNTTLYIKDFKGNHPRFIYYLLQTLHLEEFNGAAAVPGLDRNVLHKIHCIFPISITKQKEIAFALSTYDELIEVNNQRINLLEETAREFYKEWFVRMRFPGYKQAKFVKGIPKNWAIKPIGKVIDYSIGGGWGNEIQNSEFNTSGYVIRERIFQKSGLVMLTRRCIVFTKPPI
ncbi:restriction endonuclease subunit S [Paraflavitalea speifideaquila]|uniref:restriction endonuclease subunit S n=1 Tax=Paraflavitalea speifideaquila TaxID=3076558 RepID=UPI0028E7BF29|nr:restriction endonuclease subunit S [Paraflavitalea speifideiaquila]